MRNPVIRFYHNPRCSKSREALRLLQEEGVDLEVIEYLKNPPSEEELEKILSLLDMDARALLRQQEPEFAHLHLEDPVLEHKYLVHMMVIHPRLIERPIAVSAKRAVIGRPPEKVLTLLT